MLGNYNLVKQVGRTNYYRLILRIRPHIHMIHKILHRADLVEISKQNL